MADIHELTIAMDLRGDLPEAELAELRWHLGLGPRPEHITEEQVVVNEVLDLLDEDQHPVQDEHGDWVLKEYPEPAWHEGAPYAATKMPGVGFSTLVRGGERYHDSERWALTCRWEVHPDAHDGVADLIDWLVARIHTRDSFFGYQRWYEDERPELLALRDEKIMTTRDGVCGPPFWEG